MHWSISKKETHAHHPRKTISADRQALAQVEAKSTPGLRYVSNVFDMFLADQSGEFITAELDDQVVACGKFTLLPDGSAWLETLRVISECQGMGIGKRFYERFFELARQKGVNVMNRTFYPLNPPICADLARRSCVFEDPGSESLVVLGARFMPEQALHVGFFHGNHRDCLGYALQQGLQKQVDRLSCIFPAAPACIEVKLLEPSFQLETAQYIVMCARLK